MNLINQIQVTTPAEVWMRLTATESDTAAEVADWFNKAIARADSLAFSVDLPDRFPQITVNAVIAKFVAAGWAIERGATRFEQGDRPFDASGNWTTYKFSAQVKP